MTDDSESSDEKNDQIMIALSSEELADIKRAARQDNDSGFSNWIRRVVAKAVVEGVDFPLLEDKDQVRDRKHIRISTHQKQSFQKAALRHGFREFSVWVRIVAVTKARRKLGKVQE